MKIIKRAGIFFFCMIIIAAAAVLPASADNRVSSIYVTATLNSDGSADITQQWSGNFYEGTECYFPFNTANGLDILNLTVVGNGTQYETLSKWDVDASLSQKAGKCGLNKVSNGYEICWGIGEYGNNVYSVSYTVPNVVNSYDETDGFNFQFINEGMSTGPTDGRVEIKLADGKPLNDENANIWAFGFGGNILFNGGSIVATTSSALTDSNSMIIMVELNKGVVSPARTVDGSFEAVKDNAFKGSDYDDDDALIVKLILIAIGIAVVIAIIMAIYKAINAAKLRKFIKNADYFRDVPNGGNINETYELGTQFKQCTESSVIGARMLRLITSGCLEPVSDKSVGFMGSEKENVSMRLVKEPDETADSFDKSLYAMLKEAAGANGLLEKHELETMCRANPERIRKYLENCQLNGRDELIGKNCYSGLTFNRIGKLTDNGKKELSELVGLKKYLLDFSLISEREVGETIIWQDYMVYAMLFGIADKVAAQLRKIYPNSIPEIDQYERYIYCSNYYYLFMYDTMRRREREIQAARSAGSGGASSFGGGGGFSGGGFGGGTR